MASDYALKHTCERAALMETLLEKWGVPVLMAIVTGYVAILKYAATEQLKVFKDRLDEHKKENDAREAENKVLAERLRQAEMVALEQKGKISLLEHDHTGFKNDLVEIKTNIVTRAEWERQMDNVERTLGTILQLISKSPTPPRYPSDPQMPAVKPPRL